jgi:hypothetical protein
VLEFYFASIISVRSTPLREKGRIRIREAQKTKNMLILWIRIPNTVFNYAFLLKKLRRANLMQAWAGIVPSVLGFQQSGCPKNNIKMKIYKHTKKLFTKFNYTQNIFYEINSTLLHLLPLRFPCSKDVVFGHFSQPADQNTKIRLPLLIPTLKNGRNTHYLRVPSPYPPRWLSIWSNTREEERGRRLQHSLRGPSGPMED